VSVFPLRFPLFPASFPYPISVTEQLASLLITRNTIPHFFQISTLTLDPAQPLNRRILRPKHEHTSKIRLIASQAHSFNIYKNQKLKLLVCSANIYFNKQCLVQNLIPAYAKVKVAATSPAAKFTTRKTHTLRIKDEIRFLYKKKAQLWNGTHKQDS